MIWLKGFSIICLFSAAGEFVSHLLPFEFPGPLVGLMLLLVSLSAKWVPLKALENVADQLLSHLSLLFIPAGVGLMTSWYLIANRALSVLFAVVISTVAVIAITGLVVQFFAKKVLE